MDHATATDSTRGPAGASSREAEQQAIRTQLAERAGTYLDGADGPAQVDLLRVDGRSTGRLYWYRVRVGQAERQVVVKVFDPPRDRSARLRLAGMVDASSQFRREYEALRLIDRHFAALDDPRVGNVPILDRIEPFGAIVMGRVDGTPMTRILQSHHRLGASRSPERLLRVARNAGVWLREFHAVAVPPTVVDRADRAAFVQMVDRTCDYIGERLGAVARLREIAHATRAAAEAALPKELPIAVAHSDFAKRNVLVQDGERVLVLDTMARRHAPIYEDLASFTVGIRFGRLQLQTYGLAFSPTLLGAVDDALLDGYFAPTAPPTEVFRVYELLLLLDRWAAALTWGSRGPFGRPASMVANRFLEREVRRALTRLG